MTALSEEILTIIRSGVHPFVLRVMGSTAAALAVTSMSYHPAMADQLPAPSDARGILDFFGLDSDAITRVLSAAGPDINSLAAKARRKNGNWKFPLSDALETAYHQSAPPAVRPVPKTYEGYFACALQQGLRPEFACTIGLHPDDPRFAATHQDFYQVVSPQDASRDEVVANKYFLHALWSEQMEQEGEEAVV